MSGEESPYQAEVGHYEDDFEEESPTKLTNRESHFDNSKDKGDVPKSGSIDAGKKSARILFLKPDVDLTCHAVPPRAVLSGKQQTLRGKPIHGFTFGDESSGSSLKKEMDTDLVMKLVLTSLSNQHCRNLYQPEVSSSARLRPLSSEEFSEGIIGNAFTSYRFKGTAIEPKMDAPTTAPLRVSEMKVGFEDVYLDFIRYIVDFPTGSRSDEQLQSKARRALLQVMKEMFLDEEIVATLRFRFAQLNV